MLSIRRATASFAPWCLALATLHAAGCAGGSTESSCEVGLTSCGGKCVDVNQSVAHCGGCDRPCAAGDLCCDGTCEPQSNESCGVCGKPCEGGTTCVDGACATCDRADRCGPSCAPCADPRPHCFSGHCAECSEDDHCAAGEYCNTDNGLGACALCETDEHCGAACEPCSPDTYCDGKTCTTCSGHSDCPPGKYCAGTACRPCDTHDFCGRNCVRCTGTPKPYCNAAGTACALCGDDSHCKAGEWCSPSGVCEACTTAEHCGPLCASCGGGTPFCSSTGCAECLDETHCGPGLRCSNGSCFPCNTDDHCGPTCSPCTGGPDPFCDASGQKCIECKTDGHCAQGSYCAAGSCAPCNVTDHCGVACVACVGGKPHCNEVGTACVECVVEQHCPAGEFCQGGSCAACTTDDHCGPSCVQCPTDKFCNGVSCVGCCGGACAICLPGTYCKSDACAACDLDDHCGPSCVACGGATPHCKDGASCVECVKDTHCPPGSYCSGDICVPCADAARCGPTCVACAANETCCGAAPGCANLQTDAENCGQCGKVCSTFCNNGLCDASIKCSVSLAEEIYATPAVDAGGNAYVTTTDGKLRRISPTCAVTWTYTLGNYTASSPALSNDEQTVYFASAAGPARIVAVAAASGTKLWDYVISDGWSAYNTPAVAADGTIYVVGNVYTSGDYHEMLHALSPAGVLTWQYDLGGTGGKATSTGGPAIAGDGTIFALTTMGQAHAVTPAGAKKWSRALGCCVADASPALGSDGHVYVTDGTKTLFKLDAATGATLWSTALASTPNHVAPVTGSGGQVFIGLPDGRVRAFAADGAALWTIGPSGCYNASLAIGSDGVLYAANGCNGALTALAPGSGAAIWSLQVANAFVSSPNLSTAGILWVGANEKMWAVATGAVSGLASGGWPKRHGGRRNAGRP